MNLDAILAPLPGASPCGDDLSFDTAFDDILELRREDDPTLAQGAWVRELQRADWPGVVAMGTNLLTTRTKDLRLAGWWLDASARVSGWRGLADGLELVEGLCARYWDDLHPRAEGDDHEVRIGNLAWLLGRVEAMAQAAPVVGAGDERCGLADVRAARLRATRPVRDDETAHDREQRERDDRVQHGLRLLDARTIGELDADARRAQQALRALEVIVDRELGADGPAFGAARQAIDDAVGEFERMRRDSGGAVVPSVAASPTSAVAQPESMSPLSTTIARGMPGTRSEALAQLRLVAEFFRRTEPHSPVAYLADKAAQWGDMPLHTWLRSVMREPSALAHLEELLGVEPARERE